MKMSDYGQEMLIKYVQDETGKSNAVLYFGA